MNTRGSRLAEPPRRREPRHGPRPRRRARRSAHLARQRAIPAPCRRRSRTLDPCRSRCRPRALPRGSRRTRRRRAAARPGGARPVPLRVTKAASCRGETSRGRSTTGWRRPSGPSCPRAAASRHRGRRRRHRGRAGARPRPLALPSRVCCFRPTRMRRARPSWTAARRRGALGSRAE